MNSRMVSKPGWMLIALFTASLLFATSTDVWSQEVFAPEDVLKLKYAGSAQISPDGLWIAYTMSVPRDVSDDAGGAYNELHVVSVKGGEKRPFITGHVNVSSPRWSPDGSQITFLMSRGKKAKRQVWTIPFSGGEASQVTHAKSSVSTYRWHPSGKKIAYIASTPQSDREKTLDDKGYGFIYYEENLKDRNLYIMDVGSDNDPAQLTEGVSVWDFQFAPKGNMMAVAVTEKNLVDHSYMFRQIHLLDIETKALTQLTHHKGKLGNFAFNHSGKFLAYAASRDIADHAVSQAYVIKTEGGDPTNVTEENFSGHITWVGWQDKNTLLYFSGEGMYNTLSTVKAKGGKRKVILHSEKVGVVFGVPTYTKDFNHFAFWGSSPEIVRDVFYWKRGKKKLERLTNVNPWIAEKTLGKREIITYNARDGLEIEGILVYPVDYKEGTRYPTIIVVHGGPESHYTNTWLTRYFTPAQYYAGQGFVVFYPNYRASTGYGVEFGMAGYNDAAGKEFDDIADGIDHLVSEGIADKDRIGLCGGSYGGYAAAWFSTYYTKKVKAVCMFVGISNLVSKRSTTDIPYEELYVHSGKKLEDMWEMSLKRSPVYYAHQSKSAVLIVGGAADPRVHPSQSLEFYRRLKMNDHPAVRLVQYPGEGHGNRKQPGRADIMFRTIEWFEWYVKNDKPISGPLPRLDISERYGLDLED